MIFDIHAHPSLKSYVFGHDITAAHLHPAGDLDTIDAQINLVDMKAGGVSMMVCAHYLIEKKFVDHWSPVMKFFSDLQQWFRNKHVVEETTSPGRPLEQLLDIMHCFQRQIDSAETRGFNTGIAKNRIELRNMLSQGKTVFLHSIEGANCLNTLGSVEGVRSGIREMAEMGVCQFTIAHLEDNDLAPSQQGIPPGTKQMMGYTGALPDPTRTLTPAGIEAVKVMLEEGIIIDLVHSTPATRQQIYNLNRSRGVDQRPLVFSHTGLRSLAINGSMGEQMNGRYVFDHDLKILPDDEEVREIIRTRGVIGVIFANYWLNGTEEDNIFSTDKGIPDVIRTMHAIQELEQQVDPGFDCDHICIGSDMDGFTQRPDDLTSPRSMCDLVQAMKQSGFSGKQIEKICWRNYMRVLELGWGK